MANIDLNYIFSREAFDFGSRARSVLRPEKGRPIKEGTMTMLAQMAYVEPLADTGLPLPKSDSSGDELFRMGLLYSTGQGGAPLDYVSAHMLFNLAAMRGSIEAKIYRKELSQEMDPADVAEAQRAAREWLAHG